LANLVAMLIQGLAAKLGIATGMNLAEACRARFPASVCYVLWLTQEVTAMATDLAEFLGASIGINLLAGVPLIWAALITGIAVFVILALQGGGFRGLEAFIGGCALAIALCYVVETFLAQPDWSQIAYHSVVPSLPGNGALLLAVGIVGATVMPHVIYVHSNLTQGRVVPASEEEAQLVFSFERIDVIAAMGLAGLVNMAMLLMAAKVFNETGHADVATINSAYETLVPLLGGTAAGGRDFARRVWRRQLACRDDGRPGGDAGLRQLQHPDLAQAFADHDPGPRGDLSGPRPDPHARHQPGHLELHAAVSGDHAHPVYGRPGVDG
jgi:manganese transport protein